MSKRHIVWLPAPLHPGNRLPGASPERRARHPGGGWRTLHELAVAIAATGRRVELRGLVSQDELEELAAAAGVMPELPSEPLRLSSDDVVITPEGCDDPMVLRHILASPARAVLLALAPPGLFGWDFDAEAGRRLRAIADLGFELWTHMPRLAEHAERAGVPCRLLGNGRPAPYPQPLPKRWDV